MYQSEEAKKQITPTDDERELFRQKMERLLTIWPVEDIVRAGFLREMGKFDECLQVLNNCNNPDPFQQKNAQRIAGLAAKQSTIVFIIPED